MNCTRCGGIYIRGADKSGYNFRYCLQCGGEPALSPQRAAALRAEAEQDDNGRRRHSHRTLSRYDDRVIDGLLEGKP